MTPLAEQVVATAFDTLEEKIKTRTARIGIIGLGYVGLPLAAEFASAGYNVTGIDVSPAKVAMLSAGSSYILDVESSAVEKLVAAGRLTATNDFSVIAGLDTISICVPTPLRKTKDPDLSYIVDATEQIARHLHPGMLIVLESTTYPGTTEELVLEILEKSGWKVGEDFFLCFSPERVDPGNTKYQTRNIPKVVGGVTGKCTRLGAALYGQAVERVVPVSTSRVAETVKLLENTFRMINIGLANEIAQLCDRIGVDVWEVIDAAATKPFGFMPFYPGPGLGGHCIPIDPFYLSWKTKQAGIEARFIELAGQINGQMPLFVTQKIQNALNDCSRPLRGSHVHILGVAYKRDISDLRESPALDIIHLLQARGARLTYSDPYIPAIDETNLQLSSEEPFSACKAADCVVIITDHTSVDYPALLAVSRLVVDTRNALKGHRSEKIVRL
jgi:UDP-N-acetyl-D-glucosamine dehydrogenase